MVGCPIALYPSVAAPHSTLRFPILLHHMHMSSPLFFAAIPFLDSHPTKHPTGNELSSRTSNGRSPNDH